MLQLKGNLVHKNNAIKNAVRSVKGKDLKDYKSLLWAVTVLKPSWASPPTISSPQSWVWCRGDIRREQWKRNPSSLPGCTAVGVLLHSQSWWDPFYRRQYGWWICVFADTIPTPHPGPASPLATKSLYVRELTQSVASEHAYYVDSCWGSKNTLTWHSRRPLSSAASGTLHGCGGKDFALNCY